MKLSKQTFVDRVNAVLVAAGTNKYQRLTVDALDDNNACMIPISKEGCNIDNIMRAFKLLDIEARCETTMFDIEYYNYFIYFNK